MGRATFVNDLSADAVWDGDQGDGDRSAVTPRSAVLDRVGHQFAGQQDREICLSAFGTEGPADERACLGHVLGLASNGQAA